MTEDRKGRVVTFYSFKGGTGRTMALANVAWILAANGKRVLVADWDLESPGLHRFFHPFIDAEQFADAFGVIDLIQRFEWATTNPSDRGDNWLERHARVKDYAFPVNWAFPGQGTLDFLPAGQQNDNYTQTLSGMDWDAFYDRHGGGLFLDALRADMKRNYDYTLIDSRTGLSDVSSICTIHLPDVLVDCFTFSDQGIDGAATVAHNVQGRYGARNIRILPVPMRVDPAEQMKAEAGRKVAQRKFDGLPANMTEHERSEYWAAVEVPYRAFYGYEETLAVFGDQPGLRFSMLSAYEMLARYVTEGEILGLPPMDEMVRVRTGNRYRRTVTVAEKEVTLRYAPEDHVWAEWIDHVLTRAGVRVNDPWGTPEDAQRESGNARTLAIISRANAAMESLTAPADAGSASPLAVYISDIRHLPAYPPATSVTIADISEETATERVLRLVGHPEFPVDGKTSGHGTRYPREDPEVFVKVPARNARFTGREEDLLRLRQFLHSRGAAVVVPGTMPVTLQGMGGIGKTQVAAEYTHRFRGAYDLVCWIQAAPATYIDTAIAELAPSLSLTPQQTIAETARNVLDALRRGEPFNRWLVIFDNAEEADADVVRRWLPQGPGHVVITSRDAAWGTTAQPIQVEVFKRAESVAYLQQHVKAITDEQASLVAEKLGDLPIAVAAAAAWFVDTGSSVEDYLQQLDTYGPGQSVDATWDLSLQRLRERSAAAYRLLQLCSVLAPEIALELVYSDGLAEALVEFDPTVSERMVRSKLVEQINRLALLRVDLGKSRGGVQGGQIVVHRLLQHVVRSRMSVEELGEVRRRVHLILADARPRGDVNDPETWPRFRNLWPHLEAAEVVSSREESVRQLLIDRVRYLWLVGGLTIGTQVCETIDGVWSEMLEREPDDKALRRQLLHMRFNFGNILRDRARFEESLALNTNVHKEQVELLGATHPHTLMTAGGIAADLRALGRYADALERDKLTYAAWKETFGDDNPRTLSSLNNLASSYRLVGDYREAREHDETVWERRRLVQGDDHPETLATAANLGRDMREAGDYERSVAHLAQIVSQFLEVLGPDSRGTLNAQTNLAVSLRTAGRAPEAAHLLDRAYERLGATLGPDTPDTQACRLTRAVNFLAIRENDKAISELEEVHDAYRDRLGPTHPQTLVCLNNLAAAWRALGDGPKAFQLSQASHAQLAHALGPEHPHTLAAMTNVTICMAEQGDAEAALELARDLHGQLVKALGPDHPDTLRCAANLVILSRELHRAGSESEETSIRDQLVVRLGPDHPAMEAMRDGRFLHRIVDPHPF